MAGSATEARANVDVTAPLSVGGGKIAAAFTVWWGMSERGLHHLAADLEASWLADWTGVGLSELEAYLGKVAAFEAFLESRRAQSPEPAGTS
jgi:hypothetical protein